MTDLAEVVHRRSALGRERAHRRRHGQARRARAERLVRHRPRVPVSGRSPEDHERHERAAGASSRCSRSPPRTASPSASTCGFVRSAIRAAGRDLQALEKRTSSRRGASGSATPGSRRASTGRRCRELEAIVRRSSSASTSTTAPSPAMRALHAEVRRDVARRELAEHVKLGPGGIREIEFIVQALQLVRGGRDPSCARGRRSTLAILAERGSCRRTRRASSGAYVFLRNVEHRLQYLDDAQTQTCRKTRRTARASRGRWRLRDLVRVLPTAARASRRRSRGTSRAVFAEPARGRSRRLARSRASRGAAREPALRELPRGFARRFDRLIPALARRGARRRTPTRHSRAASTCSRRSRAAPRTSRSRSIRKRSSASRA